MHRAIFATCAVFFLMMFRISTADAACSSYTTINNGDPANAPTVMNNFNCAALTLGSTIDSLTSTNGQYFTYGSASFLGSDNVIGLASTYLYLQGSSSGGFWIAGSKDRTENIVFRSLTHEIDIYGYPSNTVPALAINSAGYVGIGTASPSQQLYVAGNIYATGNITCGGTCGGGWSLSGANLTPNSTTYNVGVGTVTSPTHTLDVGGTLNVTGAITCSSGCTSGPWSAPSGSIIPSSNTYNLGVGTGSPTAKVDVAGAGANGIRVLSSSASTSTSVIVGRTVSEGYFAIAGAANQWALGTAAGDVVLTNPASGKLMLSSQATTVAPTLTVTAGKVGIGTTSPSQALDVSGSVNVSGALNITGPLTCGSGCTPGPWSVVSGSIIPSSSTYNLGVGTTSPSHLLTVGDGSVALNADVFINGGTNTATGPQIVVQRAGSTKGGLGTHSRIYGGTSDALALAGINTLELSGGGTSPQVTIATNGNVGIGTTPFAWSSPFDRAVDIGSVAGISETTTAAVDLDNNLYFNGTSYIRKTATYAQIFRMASNDFQWLQGSSGSAGTAVSLTTPMHLDSSGNLTITGCLTFNGGTSGTCVSDERVKRDIKPFTSLGLAEISALRPVTYSYNGLGGTPRDSRDASPRTGLIAQQVQVVAPSLVTTIQRKLKPTDASTTDLLEVRYEALTFGLINAVKQLKAANDSHAAEIALLRSQNSTALGKLKQQANEVQDLRGRLGALERKMILRTAENIAPIRH